MSAIVYEIINIENGKKYIGHTQKLKSRISTHLSNLKNKKNISEDFIRDYEKYGRKKFKLRKIKKFKSKGAARIFEIKKICAEKKNSSDLYNQKEYLEGGAKYLGIGVNQDAYDILAGIAYLNYQNNFSKTVRKIIIRFIDNCDKKTINYYKSFNNNKKKYRTYTLTNNLISRITKWEEKYSISKNNILESAILNYFDLSIFK